MLGRKMNIKVVGEVEAPEYAHAGDVGLDLRITESVTLEPMQRQTVGCGIAFEIPSGCVGLVFPRSGLASKIVVMPYFPCDLAQVDELSDTERGAVCWRLSDGSACGKPSNCGARSASARQSGETRC